jgi:hypothetical protein
MSADGTAPDTVADITAEAIAGSSKVTTTDPTTARQRGGGD